MYFGSVRFFKHIIYGVVLLIVTLIFALLFHTIRLVVKAEGKQAVNPPEKAPVAEIPPPSFVMETPSTTANNLTGFQLLYPTMYSKQPDESLVVDNMVYLTFDDGPSKRTLEVLDTLRENKVKATFFVVGNTDEFSKSVMRRIVEEGHSIGVHSFLHDYKRVYGSVDVFLDDFYAMYHLIYEATGIKPDIFRFPGGSVNSYNQTIYLEIIDEMTRRGFTYYDWNVSSVDTNAGITPARIERNVINGTKKYARSIVLFHDSSNKHATVSALDGIIKKLKKQGYIFDCLTNKVKPIIFKK